MVVYGISTYKNFFRKDKDIRVFTAENILEKCGLDQIKLLKLCYLLGSDYNEGI